LRVELSAEAESQVLRIDDWWRSHRRASPDLFDDELDATLERVVLNPKGVVYEQEDLDEIVYRVLMSGTRHHISYVLRPDVVFVLSVWGAVKERGPKL
jgi:hypothetical protein